MSGIHVYNIKNEEHTGDNVYLITRPSILSNPYTHIKNGRTRALYVVSSRDEAIQKYSHYFDVMYSGSKEFKSLIDDIYNKYANGEDVYLGCVCKPLPCHGDVIADKITSMHIRNHLKDIRLKKKENFSETETINTNAVRHTDHVRTDT